ncbi:MAG: AraC family transcriptional regulator [Oscillospiraceae bacterium]|nr:AraC family transcriptional regulator [Oscillospiraceae bacterium]
MWQNANMDLGSRTKSGMHTPVREAKEFAFSVSALGHFFAGEQYFTERRGLDDYLFLHTISGKGIIRYGSDEYVLLPGQAILIDCNSYHLYRTIAPNVWEFIYFHVSGLCAKTYYDILAGEEVRPFYLHSYSSILSQFDILMETIMTDKNLPDLKASAILTRLMTDLVLIKNSSINNELHDRHEDDVSSAIKFIEANYQHKIKVEDIAATVHLSKFYFIKIFKAFTGASPYEYLNNYRITKAKQLLHETDLSIDEIAGVIGFVDAGGLIRCFKMAVGMTPGKYRILYFPSDV